MRDEQMLEEMLKAYYAVILPGKTLDEVGQGGLLLTKMALIMIFHGQKPAWGEAEEAAKKRLEEIRATLD